MSNLSVNTQNNYIPDFHEIEDAIKTKISDFYLDLWSGAVLSFCRDNPDIVLATYDKVLKKGQKGYISLDWNSSEINEDGATVTIGHNTLENLLDTINTIIDAHPLDADQLISFAKTIDLSEGIDSFWAVSRHSKSIATPMTVYYKENNKTIALKTKNFPLSAVFVKIDGSVLREKIKREEVRQRVSKENTKTTEQSKEDTLYDWLRIQGIDAERQVKTSSGHVIDLWIPAKMMIELKKSSVSGNDICQCIEYASEYRLPIVLVGDKLSSSASRGLKGFNKLCPKHKIIFVTWDSVFDILKGKLLLEK